MQFFHLCDNANMKKPDDKDYDPLFKVRKVFDEVRNRCRKQAVDEFQSIDEQLIPFKGRHRSKQYLPAKPHKWGIKMITRASSSGTVYDFIMYAGKQTELMVSLPDKSTVHNCVLSLCDSIPKNAVNVKLFMDNYYMTLEIMEYLLKERNIHTTGTIRSNRLQHCPLPSEKDLKKRGRGSYEQYVDYNSNITAVRWFDNKIVTVVSTYLESNEPDEVRRWDKKLNQRINIKRPRVIGEYNKYMGGIDLNDMLLAMYRNNRKSKKWYMKMVYYLIWTAITNSWLLYRKSLISDDKNKRISLKEFMLIIARHLVKANKTTVRKVGRPSLPTPQPAPKQRRALNEISDNTIGIRNDHTDHFPKHTTKGRCKQCEGGYTRWMCEKCGIHLCLNEHKNCFKNYHID
jgi:hypothetical protein